MATNSETVHNWANRIKESGKNSNGTIFYDGDTIFSYGSHFPMARLIGEDVVLVTSESYSVTTSHHISIVYRATSHKESFTVPTFDNHVKNADYLFNQVGEEKDRILRSRARIQFNLECLKNMFDKFNLYLITFSLPNSLLDFEHVFTDEENEKLEKKIENEKFNDEARKAREKADRKRIMFETGEQRKNWLNGEGEYYPYSYYADDGYARLKIKGHILETSQGAKLPLQAAVVVWEAYKEGKEVDQVGGFSISYTEDIFSIGCHSFKKEEIERVLS